MNGNDEINASIVAAHAIIDDSMAASPWFFLYLL